MSFLLDLFLDVQKQGIYNIIIGYEIMIKDTDSQLAHVIYIILLKIIYKSQNFLFPPVSLT
jgi:hypothetical protein